MKRSMLQKVLTSIVATGMVFGITACNTSTVESVPASSVPAVTVSAPVELEDSIQIPEGYRDTAGVFGQDGISFNVPADMIGDWITVGQNEYIKIEAQPVYVKEYGIGIGSDEATNFIKPMVIVRITNLTEETVTWHWDSASADESEGLMTYINAYDTTLGAGETATRILSVTPGADAAIASNYGVKYPITSATIGSFVVNADGVQLGDTILVSVDFSNTEIPEF